VLDATSRAIVAVTGAGLINYVNPRAVSDFGYAPEELIGKSVEMLVPLPHVAGHVALRDGYLAASEPAPWGPTSSPPGVARTARRSPWRLA
jgi:PAS domain S-box-containing protein